jgi:hypothetical protein
MKHTRVIVTHYGGPEALRVVEEECPEPKRGEVRVRVHAADARVAITFAPRFAGRPRRRSGSATRCAEGRRLRSRHAALAPGAPGW